MGAVLSCACDDDQEHAAQQSGRGEQAEAQAAGHHSQDHTPLEDSCTGLCRLSQQRPSGPDNQFAADAGCGAPGELDVNASTHEVVLQLQVSTPYACDASGKETFMCLEGPGLALDIQARAAYGSRHHKLL